MVDNGNADFYEDREVLAANGYNGKAYHDMVKWTVEDIEYMQELNIWRML